MDFSRREDNSDPNWQKRQNTLTNYFQVRRAPQGLVVQKTYQQDGNKDPKEGQMYFPVSGLSIQGTVKCCSGTKKQRCGSNSGIIVQ